MSSRSFRSDGSIPLVLDTSVIINLIATGQAAALVRALPNPAFVTRNVLAELDMGCRFSAEDRAALKDLLDQGLVKEQALGNRGLSIFETLIDGSTGDDLDDGESATIACANEHGACAVIDERKARRVCGKLYPHLLLACTAELLLVSIETISNHEASQNIFLRALQVGRMRVPSDLVNEVVLIIGVHEAANCPSLPRIARNV
jgi:predicted nucleic acid-binding protein